MFDRILDREIEENAPKENPPCDTCEALLGHGGCSAPTLECQTCGAECQTLVNCEDFQFCSVRCARAEDC